ncbi:hypothetical protein GCM10023096_40630 [Nonomuraea ferruginea]
MPRCGQRGCPAVAPGGRGSTGPRISFVTPGRVIRGTFATASDAGVAGDVLYPLRGGPSPAGVRARVTEVLDSDNGT